MLVYVLFGGMIATTWVQIIKAVLLLFGVTLLAVLVLAQFHFSPGELYAAVAARYGQARARARRLVTDPIDAVSLGLALMLGLLGLPHILMRFYTVPDARAARASVLYATGFIGYFYLIIPIVGFGASALVGRDVIRQVDAGGNMAAPLVAELLGGTQFLGFIAAVAFATILAVVAGLTLAGASALSHDIFTHVVRGGQATEAEQVRVARISTVAFGLVAVVLGILFKGQNVAFMVGLAFAVACSANFPPLLLSIVWRRFNTAGAVCSIVAGALASVGADRPQPDDLGRSAAQRRQRSSRCAIRPSSRCRCSFLVGIVGVAAHPRARGGGEVRRREAADVPGRRGGMTQMLNGRWQMADGGWGTGTRDGQGPGQWPGFNYRDPHSYLR